MLFGCLDESAKPVLRAISDPYSRATHACIHASGGPPASPAAQLPPPSVVRLPGAHVRPSPLRLACPHVGWGVEALAGRVAWGGALRCVSKKFHTQLYGIRGCSSTRTTMMKCLTVPPTAPPAAAESLDSPSDTRAKAKARLPCLWLPYLTSYACPLQRSHTHPRCD